MSHKLALATGGKSEPLSVDIYKEKTLYNRTALSSPHEQLRSNDRPQYDYEICEMIVSKRYSGFYCCAGILVQLLFLLLYYGRLGLACPGIKKVAASNLKWI